MTIESEMQKACDSIADIVKGPMMLNPKGGPIEMFVELLNNGESPRMASVMVKRFYDGDDIDGMDFNYDN